MGIAHPLVDRALKPHQGVHSVLRRSVPFGLTGALALASASLPPGPLHPMWLLVATITVVVMVAVASVGIPRRLPRRLRAVNLLLSVAAITLLGYGAGPQSGLTAMLLLPVIFSALYGDRWESFVTVPAVIGGLTFIWSQGTATPAALVRNLLVYAGLSALVSLTAHGLRSRLSAALAVSQEKTRQLSVMADASRALAASLDPDLVIDTAAHLAAILASPRGETPRRGQYAVLQGDEMVVAADSDEAGVSVVGERWPIADHPAIAEGLRSGHGMGWDIDLSRCGPHLRETLRLVGVTSEAWVTVRVDGRPHGILIASSRGRPIPGELVERLGSLGLLTELALTNALTSRRFQREATEDALTGLANRRGFELELDRISGRRPFAILAIDVDGLKSVNDEWGHAEGDRLISGVAAALAAVVRRGDTLARVGGDEFAVITTDASPHTIAQLSGRMHAAVGQVVLASGTPRVSIGAGLGSVGDEPRAVYRLADQQMYEAKPSRPRTPVVVP